MNDISWKLLLQLITALAHPAVGSMAARHRDCLLCTRALPVDLFKGKEPACRTCKRVRNGMYRNINGKPAVRAWFRTLRLYKRRFVFRCYRECWAMTVAPQGLRPLRAPFDFYALAADMGSPIEESPAACPDDMVADDEQPPASCPDELMVDDEQPPASCPDDPIEEDEQPPAACPDDPIEEDEQPAAACPNGLIEEDEQPAAACPDNPMEEDNPEPEPEPQ